MRSLALALAATVAAVAAPPSELHGAPAHPMQTRRLGVGPGIAVRPFVHWDGPKVRSNSTVTLQVVSNPLLDRSVPVSKTFFEMLSRLQIDHVRYVPWFPYPWYGVPELEPPTSGGTSWNFSFVGPMLEDFLAATHDIGHSAIPNFSTQPTWLYNTTSWSYPSDPKATDFAYPRGTALRDPSMQALGAYYGRLLRWIVNGSFVDEAGRRHTGGPARVIAAWEVFNEPINCHGMTHPSQYADQVGAVVEGIQSALGRQADNLTFVVGALQQGGAQAEWAQYLLDPSHYSSAAARKALESGIFSFHFYANSDSRTDPESYESFFTQTDAYVASNLKVIVDARASLSPTTRLDADELGVILPGDNDPKSPMFPLVYWNAAAAKFAYVWSQLALAGVEVIGMSQLAGSPVIPEWGIVDPQFPSVAILNWTDGSGTARYWTLDMISKAFAAGDDLPLSGVAMSPACGVIDGRAGYANMTITCAGSGRDAHISSIDFAAFGTPSGQCGSYAHNASCDAEGVQGGVEALCLNQHSCVIPSYPAWGDPCYDEYKRLVVQARCSDGNGATATGMPSGLHVQGVVSRSDGKRRLLVVNKGSDPTSLSLADIAGGKCEGATSLTVDEATGFGPPRHEAVADCGAFKLARYAVSIVTLP